MKTISKLYFDLFDKAGTLRLTFVLSCLFGGVSLHTWLNSYLKLDELWWVIFWFYFPAVIIFAFKFIRDGYAQDKRNKK